MFKCEFCKNDYSTKSTLYTHQKTAKKCIALRGENTEIKNEIFKCDDCEYTTMRKSNLVSHVNSCKTKIHQKYSQLEANNIELENRLKTLLIDNERLITENKKLLEQVQKYEDKLFQLASKPTSVNNTNNTTTINNKTENLVVFDWSQDNIKKKVEDNFTLKHLENGIKGVAKFTYDHIITQPDGKKNLMCSDPSRMIFKYKDSEGVLQKDVRATKLKNAVKDPIITKSKTLFVEENSRLFDEIARGKDDDENNDAMMEQITTLKDNFLKVKNIDDNDCEYAKELTAIT